ncbi:DUF4232 domain-containing protein [Rathayibacter sp. VKM Ac-2857]|uniref:DUF4232 domain-containing protein n=1 Tax=Rathayibacter sp. VKM Ac-2857 TaxID=2739020 RepID=UPI00156395A6|nr:DUF4232 domain-containing protein [Rathayibacter sp. VKM Ac-2857]NQX17259.1 DUF4232 domain-containing protein [Rathayibacter sp. VKM Ac-2857]
MAHTRTGTDAGPAALTAAVLWLGTGAIAAAVQWNGLTIGGQEAVLPLTIPGYVWARPLPWSLLVGVIGAVVVAVVHLLVSRLAGGSGRAAFVTVWFAAVVAGGVAGLAQDAAAVAGALPPMRLRMLFSGLGAQAAVGAYWGLVQGWLPALMVVLLSRRAGRDSARPTRLRPVLLAGVSVLAVTALVVAGVVGQREADRSAVAADAIANGYDEDSGALPDPYAEGTPPPTSAPAEGPLAADACTPDVATPLFSGTDAATGHRMLTIELLNFSEAPCVIEGYPDLAFADQNGNALDVDLVRGGSFMTEDAGPVRVEIPAGGTAVTRLGWDAGATPGALVATTLYCAQIPGGVRGSWPVQTDIVAGAEVAVTAWALRPADESATP